MDEERALLAAIVAHPDEDAPRLVYADWLDEHADALPVARRASARGRAEFIRVQCAYARLRYGSPEYERDGAELNSRSFELRQEFETTWAAELALPPNRHNRYWFRRGMVGAVWCSARYFLNHAVELLAAVPVECVTFRRLAALNMNALEKSPHVLAVRGIEFLMDETPPGILAAYLRDVPTSGLRSLEFTALTVNSLSPYWTTRNVALGHEIARSPGLAGLRRLDLKHAGVGEAGAQALIESQHLTGLTYLNLEDNGIDEETEAALRQRFGDAVILGQSDYPRFTLAELGWH